MGSNVGISAPEDRHSKNRIGELLEMKCCRASIFYMKRSVRLENDNEMLLTISSTSCVRASIGGGPLPPSPAICVFCCALEMSLGSSSMSSPEKPKLNAILNFVCTGVLRRHDSFGGGNVLLSISLARRVRASVNGVGPH
jgi:hypothetical protein